MLLMSRMSELGRPQTGGIHAWPSERTGERRDSGAFAHAGSVLAPAGSQLMSSGLKNLAV